MNNILVSVQLFISFLRISILRMMRYRFDFIMGLCEGLTMLAINLIFFTAAAQATESSQQPEWYLLTIIFQIFSGIFYGLFIDNITGLKFYINRGDLDLMILKPVNPQFYISLRFINFGHLTTAMFSAVLLVFSVNYYHISVSIPGILVAAAYIFLTVLAAYGLLLITTSIAIVLTASGNVSGMILPLLSLGRYPRRIYRGFLLPLLIVIAPALLLCDFAKDAICGSWNSFWLLGTAALIAAQLYLATLLFRRSCLNYKSTGS